MAKSFIALIFPEYNDEGNNVTSREWYNNELFDDEFIGYFIKELQAFTDFFSDENCCLIYDAKNVEAFSYPMRMLPECYPSRERFLHIALNGLENWRANRKSGQNDVFVVNGSNIKDEIRAEIACRIRSHPNDSYLLVVQTPKYVAKQWHLSDENGTCCIDSQPLSIKTNFEWLASHHHPIRCYNWNPKHGENGTGAHPGNKGEKVSVLLCSREHAEKIMQKAIGISDYDHLYCYDEEQGYYMEYVAECKFEHLPPNATTRKYHSFHLESDESIPNRVKKKLGILMKE